MQRKSALSVKTFPAQDRSSGFIAGRATSPCDALVEPILGFILPETHQPQISPLHRLQFKSRRTVLRPTHAAMPCLLCLSPKNSTHHHAPHRIFAAIHSRAARDAPSPTPDFPTGFFTTKADFPARFFTTDARPSRRIALNCDRSQTKSQKLRVVDGKQAKIAIVQALPIRLSSKQNTQNRQSHTQNAAI